MASSSGAPSPAFSAPPAPAPAGGLSSAASSAAAKVGDLVARVRSGSAATIAAVVTLLIILVVLVYLLMRYLRRDLDSTVIISNSRRLAQSTSLEVSGDKLPVTVNGQEYAFSFWLYLPKVHASSEHKVLMYRGAGEDKAGSPLIVLHKNTNRMYIILRTTASNTPASINDVLNSPNNFVIATIEYVPLQRWVHMVFTVQDSLLTVYMDGDPYTVESVADLEVASSAARPIISGINGKVVVPKNSNGQLDGYLGRLIFFNYALTPRDVQRLYRNGPRGSSAAAALGVASYGVRSPIYRLDEKTE